jgi:pimeloyl-ACP methyl ester carboxylesterase
MNRIYKSEAGERAVRERYEAFLKRWPVPHRPWRVATRQGETFIVASGPEHAPAVLLLHGAMANSAVWMGDIVSLAEHFRVYAVDVIGEPGMSAPSRPPLASEAYAEWLDDVMQKLALERAAFAGVSLGGWIALDYATRRPDRVEALVLLCPGGVGRQKVSFVFKALALGMCGAWGRRKLRELVLGRAPSGELSPAARAFSEFLSLIHANFRPRREKLPVFGDEALRRLDMPVLTIAGGRDVLLDSAETKRRLEANVANVTVRYLPEAGHFVGRQTDAIIDFLKPATSGTRARQGAVNSLVL